MNESFEWQKMEDNVSLRFIAHKLGIEKWNQIEEVSWSSRLVISEGEFIRSHYGELMASNVFDGNASEIQFRWMLYTFKNQPSWYPLQKNVPQLCS